MPLYVLTRQAERDLDEIASYTSERWGVAQATAYIRKMRELCQQLAASPHLGRRCEEIRSGLHRMEYGGHVLFYRVTGTGITVSRILHRRMLPELHGI